jgi:hypothetical protein
MIPERKVLVRHSGRFEPGKGPGGVGMSMKMRARVPEKGLREREKKSRFAV